MKTKAGRPAKPDKLKKNCTVTIYITEEQKRLFEKMAENEFFSSVSNWVRHAALQKANENLR